MSSTWCASRASARSTARRRRRTNTPLMALPLGELDTKWPERARMLTDRHGRGG
nr:MAG TPA: hypothetical protein [Caudoviricetes sp.]